MWKWWKTQGQTEPAKQAVQPDHEVYGDEDLLKIPVHPDVEENFSISSKILPSKDLTIRYFKLSTGPDVVAGIIYMNGMVDRKLTDEVIFPSLTRFANEFYHPSGNILERVKEHMVSCTAVNEVKNFRDITDRVLYGGLVLFLEGYTTALAMDVKGWAQRSLSEPESELVVHGPREGFIETLLSNIVLLRRRLRSPNLVFETLQVGRLTRTDVAVVYLRGLASPELVQEVKDRISRIDIDGILESNYIREFIQDHPYTPFPLTADTERPERVVAGLMSGRVAILVDGTPIALVVPTTIVSLMQAAEDYYSHYILASGIRLIRYIAIFASLFLPSLYIAITIFHQEMLPTPLLVSVAAGREGVPFPGFVEALFMEITFEIIREAGIRLPAKISQAVSIVGALVIGQAAVQAGIISPIMIIVVAVTGVASFATAQFSLGLTIRYLRFPLMVLAATLGMYGVMLGGLFILVHLNSLRSFGVPYLSPIIPYHKHGYTDFIIRPPFWGTTKRPQELVKENQQRVAPGSGPQVPGESKKDKRTRQIRKLGGKS